MNHQSAAAAYLSARKRQDFKAREDKYAAKRGSLGEAANGFGPFDVTKNLFDDRQRDLAVNRLNAYRNFWRFYRGQHHINEYQDGEKKPVYNFCGSVVDKSSEFFCARGWRVKMSRGNELVGEALDRIWEANSKKVLTQIISQYAAVTGDAFVYVTISTKDSMGRELPKSKWRVALIPLNPSYCFPVFEHGEMTKILIQFPVSKDPLNSSLYSIVIDKETYQTFRDDVAIEEPQRNPFGCVNVAHFRNLPLSYSDYGVSDLERITGLNQSYNTTAFQIERILRYHAEPTTIIQGARASALEKGANKVWSGIPEKGKVYNLELQTDLAASTKYLESIFHQICILSNTPRVVLDGSDMPHSNTPGVSLELMFKPLIDKTRRRRDSMEQGFRRTNNLIMIAHDKILGDPLSALADYPEQLEQSCIEWTSAMPRDEKNELEIAKLKKDLGIVSRAKLMRQFGDYEDSEQAALEIAADNMFDLANACELARSEQGLPPVLSTVFLSSIYLTEDLQKVQAEVAKLDKQFPEEKEVKNVPVSSVS